ncbi:Hypothetical predicted protein [Mytilus galloprovincialis]|uniref:Myb/SANT-like DNA-binding domain-containing protein n=1 Tax=Mytilus galloprovincialis TaxID=29158 RepID=A0A8B6GP46_MYTGA|nr:Hypothetical predicted protein [Mytilus galloprovincialis]
MEQKTDLKRKRSENFPKASLSYLVDLVEENHDVIKSKQTNSVTNAKKNQVWVNITNSVNARAGGPKWTVEQIKEKWRKSCSKAKLEANDIKRVRNKTGGGPHVEDVDDTTNKIIVLHEDAPHFFGIDGGIDVGVLEKMFPDAKEIKHSNESTEERPVFEMSLPVNPHTASSTCSKDSTMKNDVITTVASTEVNTSVGHYSVISKAKEMEAEIMTFLKNYKHIKSLPKIGNSILNEYDDVTKSMSDDERDELTEYLCTFKEINPTAFDVPSMVHNTIAYIINYSSIKGIAKSSEKWTEPKNQEETHVIEDDAKSSENMTRYEKRKVVEDFQIKCLKQEHIKLKNENIKLLSEIELINEKKVITVLKKKLIKLQLKKMRLDMKVENEC